MAEATISGWYSDSSTPKQIDIEQNTYLAYGNTNSINGYRIRISIPNVKVIKYIDVMTFVGEKNPYPITFTQSEISDIWANIKTGSSIQLGIVIERWQGYDGTQFINKLGESAEYVSTYSMTDYTPVFTNFDWEDSNTLTKKLTGNSQAMVKSYSNLTVTISSDDYATARKGATMYKYQLVCGDYSTEVYNTDSSGNYVLELDYVVNQTFYVYAIDSRGNSTKIETNITNWIDYSRIIIKECQAERTNGVDDETTLDLSGYIWNNSFGAVNNAIVALYRYRETSESATWSDYIEISPTLADNSFSFEKAIVGDENTEDVKGFSKDKSFYIQVIVNDKITRDTLTITLNSAKPQMAIAKDGVSFGAEYDDSLGGAMQITGDIYQNGELLGQNIYSTSEVKTNGIWTDGKPIYRKVINTGAISSTPKTVAHNISNFETLTNFKGFAYSGSNTYMLPRVTFDSLSQQIGIIIGSTTINIQAGSDANFGNSIVILEYTKTTD